MTSGRGPHSIACEFVVTDSPTGSAQRSLPLAFGSENQAVEPLVAAPGLEILAWTDPVQPWAWIPPNGWKKENPKTFRKASIGAAGSTNAREHRPY
jgi:hypothetical protein